MPFEESADLQLATLVAKEATVEYGFRETDTSHLLIGLVLTPDGYQETLGGLIIRLHLNSINVDVESFIEQIEKSFRGHRFCSNVKHPPFTKGAKKAFKYAEGMAGREGYKITGSDHLLCGIYSAGGIALNLLQNYDITLEKINNFRRVLIPQKSPHA